MVMDGPKSLGGRPRTQPQSIRTSIGYWRGQRGLSQEQLGALVGQKQPQIAKWETGRELPTWAQVQAIASALSVTPSDLYNDDLLRAIRGAAAVA